jgi:phosphotransferase system  glucose/maltose/N-acetylglucosamine-specific IIC component
VIRRVWRTVIRFLGSAALALWLLVFIGVWSLAATAVPQGTGAAPEVVAWASKYGALEPVVRVVGLHQAFTAPVFTVCVILLALSTAVCSWKRTKVAIGRARTLSAAAEADHQSIAESHDLEIARDPALGGNDALALASETLARFGIKSKRRGDVIAAVSPRWSVWGSSVFHWALLVLMIAAFVGNLQRSEGSMSIPVGETKVDAPASYLSVSAGPLHDWLAVHRSIRVDAFDPDFKVGGVDRGAVPTVSVLDAAGKVVVKQRVYPNMKLHSGSLSINAPGVGLAVYLSMRSPTGAEVGRLIQIVDFSQMTSGGTVPQESFTSRDSAGKVQVRLDATVPLDRAGAGYGEWIPKEPKARVRLVSADGTVLVDRVVRPGQSVPVPGGGTARLVGIGWYSRLSLVDDPTIPFIYAAMVVAALGLTLTLVARQQLVLATVLEGPGGAVLAIRMRLWRNTSTNRDEMVDALTSALQGDDKETKS